MTKLSFACGLVLSTAVAAWSSVSKAAPTATTAVAPAGATAPSKASMPPKLVCESTNDTGSHMQHRVCLTPEQIAQRHKDSQQAAQDFQNRAQPINSEGKPPA